MHICYIAVVQAKKLELTQCQAEVEQWDDTDADELNEIATDTYQDAVTEFHDALVTFQDETNPQMLGVMNQCK